MNLPCCVTRHPESPVACVRWLVHGVCRLDVRAVLVRRLGYYGQTAAWYAHRLLKILKELEASCLQGSRQPLLHYWGSCVTAAGAPRGWVHIASGRNQGVGGSNSSPSGVTACTPRGMYVSGTPTLESRGYRVGWARTQTNAVTERLAIARHSGCWRRL
jgi:hypothetical protein